MESNMEYIEAYFNGLLGAGEKEQFEKRIAEDSFFAEDVAFYLSSIETIKEDLVMDKKRRFKELYEEQKALPKKQIPVRKLWAYAAAAAVLAAIVLSGILITKPVSTQKLAENYIAENFTTLGVNMGTREDELQKGLRLYNEGRFAQALQQFQKLINLDSTDFSAKKYAGIAALKLQQYDRAITYFKLLKDQPGLYANPGTFLQATTLLKRNLPGDTQAARVLLEEVVQDNLEGSETAKKWLKKW